MKSEIVLLLPEDENITKRTSICNFCKETFASDFTLLRLKSLVYQAHAYQFTCNECSKIFKRKNNLRFIGTHITAEASANSLVHKTE